MLQISSMKKENQVLAKAKLEMEDSLVRFEKPLNGDP